MATVSIKITSSKRKRIVVVVAAVLLLAFYIYSQITILTSNADASIIYSYFMPFFVVLILASIFFEVSAKPPYIMLILKAVCLLICIYAVMHASEIFLSRFLWQLVTKNPAAFFMGFALLIFIVVFFYGLTGSVPWGLRSMTILIMLYCFVNYYVTIFRGTPLLPMDLFTAGTAMDVLGSYSFTWNEFLTESLLIFGGVFVLAPRLKFPKLEGRKRIVFRIVALIIPLVFVGVTVQRNFIYGNNFQASTWEQTRTQKSHGNILNFYSNICEAFVWAPEGYSSKTVEGIAARYTSDSVKDAKVKPDVILILGESWADLVPEGYAVATQDAIPYIRSLTDGTNSDVRTLVSSTYGAGTSRSEFEVFTGAAQAYGMSQAPFQFVVNEPIPNLVSSFKQLGYDTTALHTGLKESWDRERAFPLMGFDAYYDQFDMDVTEEDYVREYVSDSVLYNEALEVLNASSDPQFLYLITIATHGGYRDESYPATVEIEEPQGVFPRTEQYLSLLREADKDLESFIKQLENRDRPTLVVFYGDHLPYVEDEYNNSVLKESDDWMWAHTTFYGVWANYELPETAYDDYESLSINYIGTYLMEAAGLPLTGYQKFLRDGASEYSTVSTSAFITPSGERVHIDEAKETELAREQAIMQYNLVYDLGNIPVDFYTLRE